jgi:hypothetical protein
LKWEGKNCLLLWSIKLQLARRQVTECAAERKGTVDKAAFLAANDGPLILSAK